MAIEWMKLPTSMLWIGQDFAIANRDDTNEINPSEIDIETKNERVQYSRLVGKTAWMICL